MKNMHCAQTYCPQLLWYSPLNEAKMLKIKLLCWRVAFWCHSSDELRRSSRLGEPHGYVTLEKGLVVVLCLLMITTWPRLNCKHWPFKQFLAVQTMLHVTFRFLISKFVQIFVVYLLSAVYLKPIYYWDALHVLSVVTFRQNCWTLKMAPAQRWIHPLYGDHCRCLYISHFRNLRNALVGGEASAVNCGIHCHKHKEFKVLPIYHMLHHDWHSNDWKWLILFFKIG